MVGLEYGLAPRAPMSGNLKMLEPSYFEGHRQQPVRISSEDAAVEAKVVEVKQMDPFEGQERPRYSVVLEGPAEPLLDQRIYDFEFPDGQCHSLFMVPLGPKGDAMRYELVFT